MKGKQIFMILPCKIRDAILKEHLSILKLQEIRLRVGHPIILCYQGQEILLPHQVTEAEVRETLDYVANYSLYAYENELRQGFLTVEGGHRVGMSGQVLMENGRVKNLKYITSLNIRISHEILHCADKLFPYITEKGILFHTMIISPPRCGKTTILRDLVRQISDGNSWILGSTVGVVDERSELAGCYQGIPQNHIGMRTDVLDACPKAEGMMMLIRSMSPQVIAVDEIGAENDIRAIQYAMHCGCKMLVTAHGESLEEFQKKPLFEKLIREQCFERFVVLENRRTIGEIRSIHDKNGNVIC